MADTVDLTAQALLPVRCFGCGAPLTQSRAWERALHNASTVLLLDKPAFNRLKACCRRMYISWNPHGGRVGGGDRESSTTLIH